MASKKTKLADYEVSLIKAMLQDPTYNKQEIVAYFSRPGRTINQGRISQIAKGQIYPNITPATPRSCRNFWQAIDFLTSA